MDQIYKQLESQGIGRGLLKDLETFREKYPVPDKAANRLLRPALPYFGGEILEMSIAALLQEENLLLSGSKATGKNVLAENLAWVFQRPLYNVSFHVNTDSSSLIGTDTFVAQEVRFREGPVYQCAVNGGFGILDEINMAKNEALAVLHAALDFRRSLDVPGYEKIDLRPETRFIATMNYGYAGTRDLNEALTSRFAVLDMPIISVENLQKLISRRYPNISTKIRDQLVKLYGELERKAESAEISDSALDLRGLLDAIALMEQGLASGDALEMCIVNKSFDAYERGLIRDVIAARIPGDLSRDVVFSV